MYRLSRIPTTAQLRALEAAWIKNCHPNWGMVLMESAGLSAAKIALALSEGGPIAVVCGRGNNGGDGLVVARHLKQRGAEVSVHMVAGEKEPPAESESAINKRILSEAMALPINYFTEDSLDSLQEATAFASLIVDALLGTGLDRQVSGLYAKAIEVINSSGQPVLSIDLPSGINSDTGQVMGTAVEADATCAIGYLKAGLLNYPGAELAGVITIIDIGLPDIATPPSSIQTLWPQLSSPIWWLATHAHVRDWLPPRPPDGHKGTFGKVLAIAGSLGMGGAAMLASRTVLRSGAGYALLAAPRRLVEHLPAEEIVYLPVNDTAGGAIDLSAYEQIDKEMLNVQSVVLGPGLDGQKETTQLIEKLLARIDKPCVVDADGLNAIARLKEPKLANPEGFVFTPHPKELERLTGKSVEEIQSDRIGAATQACERFKCNIVLKGAHTVVATPREGVFIVPTGNSGMATPGAGDVLSGIIGSFMALGLKPSFAAVAGAYVHGAAGDLAADKVGEDGLVASDIMQAVPHVLAEIRDGDFQGRLIEQEVLE